MPKLTKRTIDALTTDRAEAFAWDTIVRGFGVRVRKGGSKTFILKYRMGSAVRRHSLGKVGSPYTVDEAREAAAELLRREASPLPIWRRSVCEYALKWLRRGSDVCNPTRLTGSRRRPVEGLFGARSRS